MQKHTNQYIHVDLHFYIYLGQNLGVFGGKYHGSLYHQIGQTEEDMMKHTNTEAGKEITRRLRSVAPFCKANKKSHNARLLLLLLLSVISASPVYLGWSPHTALPSFFKTTKK